MTWNDKIQNDAFNNIINNAIKHLDKNGALKITGDEARALFNLPVKKKAVSKQLEEPTPQEQAMAIMAKFLKKNQRSGKAVTRKIFRKWAKATERSKKVTEREAKKAEKLAEAQAEKERKKEEREAKKAEKLAEAEAEKARKKEEREAKKAEKLAEAEAEKERKKEEKKAEREAKKAEKLAEAEAEKEKKKEAKEKEKELRKKEKADKLAKAKEEKKEEKEVKPCPKCYEGSGKMMGHRGRCKVTAPSEKKPKKEKKKEEETKSPEEFVECPKCAPGSGKPKGHRGKCKGSKKVKKEEEKKNEADETEMNDMLKHMMGEVESPKLEVVIPSVTQDNEDGDFEGQEEKKEQEEEEEEQEEEVTFTEDMKVTVGGTEYYKTSAQGMDNVIFTYPDQEPVGQLEEDGETITPFEFEDEDDGEE